MHKPNSALLLLETILAGKMVLTGGLVLLLPGTSAQVVSGLLVSQFYILILITYKPCKEPTDDSLQFFASFQILLTLLAGLLLKMDDPDNRYYEHVFMTYVLDFYKCNGSSYWDRTMLFQDAIFLGFRKVIKILLQRMNKKLCRSKKKSETKIEPCKSTLGENDKKKDRSQEPTVKESPASTRAHHEHNHMHHKHHAHGHTHHNHYGHGHTSHKHLANGRIHNTHHHSRVEIRETNYAKLKKADNEREDINIHVHNTADQNQNIYNNIVTEVEKSEAEHSKLQRVKLEASQAKHRKSTELRLAQRKKSKKTQRKKDGRKKR